MIGVLALLLIYDTPLMHSSMNWLLL